MNPFSRRATPGNRFRHQPSPRARLASAAAEWLEPRIAPASLTGTHSAAADPVHGQVANDTTYVWNGSVSSDWFDAGNWTPNGVPGAGDSATLDSSSTINLTSPVTVANFTQTNGTLSGNAVLSISSAFMWSGGTEAGTGTTEVQEGGVLQISGAAAKTLTGRSLNLFGNTTWSGTGNIVFNSGALRNEPGSFFEIQTDADLVDGDGTDTVANFTNSGTLYKSTGTLGSDATEFNGVVFNDFGPTLILAGELRLEGGGVAGGAMFDLAGGAQLTLTSSFTMNSGSQITDVGTLLIDNGGTLDTADPLDLSGTLILHAGGAITGTGDVTIDGTAHWTGGMIGGSGQLIISSNGTLEVSGPDAKTLTRAVLNEGTLNVEAGTLTFGGGFTQTFGATNLNGGNLAQAGTLSFQGGTLNGTGTIAGSVANDGAMIQPGGAGAIGVITITGDYTQTSGSLEIEIAGTTPGTQFDQLSVGGAATLGDTLDVTVLNSFEPTAGENFAVLSYADHTGAFDTINLPHGLAANVLATTLTLSATSMLPPNIVTTEFDVVDASDDVVSLREAILYANSHPGPDTISFAIPGAGVHTLSLTTALPTIADTTILDGYSQPGASANTLVSGDNAVLQIELHNGGGVLSGLEITGSDVTVRGLAITGFADGGAGLLVDSTGTNAVIAGNFIGLDATGTGSGNTQGVFIAGAVNVTVGGTAAGDRNVISGNASSGVVISGSDAMDNEVLGNFIGTDLMGAKALANGSIGVLIGNDANHNVIGGITPGALNVISGNAPQNGVVIDGPGSDANLVEGNFIGTNAAGTGALANFFGVVISNGAQDNVIGGTAAGAGNLISGNSVAGVAITGAGTANNLVEGNHIGLNVSGTLPLHNGTGVFLANTGGGNTVGGTAAGAGNLIAFNQTGILVDSASRGEVLLGNSVQSNVNAQIDLGGDGATPNDGGTPPDIDTGANDLQNFPIISAAVIDAAGLHFAGSLASTPDTTFRLEFFEKSAVGSDGTLQPTFLDFTTVTTDAQGHATFNFLSSAGAQAGDQVVATATDATGAGTSELAPAVIVTPPQPAISIHDAIALEGNAGTTAMTFTLTLDHAQPDAPVTVHFATSDFTAQAGSDYVAQSGMVTFAPGTTQQTFTIDIDGDTLAEFRERFHVTLSDASYATIGTDSAFGIIQDDDHHFIAAGSGHGSTLSIFETTATTAMHVTSLKPFGAAFQGGVRVAVGDINGDGVDDFVAAAGSGNNGRVRVFDGTTMLPFTDPQHAGLSTLKAFPGYIGGVFVAVGDVDGDGFGDIVVSTGTGHANKVKVFSGADGSLLTSFQAFGQGVTGVRVATGDVNGDGYADVIVGSGTGSAVKVFDVHDSAAPPVMLQNFANIFAKSYHSGVFVAAGDLGNSTQLGTFDGTDDLIVSAGAGRANVRIVPEMSVVAAQTILAYARPFHGVRVATADVNGDGIADILAGQGSGGSATISVLSGLDFQPLLDFILLPKGSAGVYVG